MLKFEKVTKLFKGPQGEVCAVRDATFSVQAGELTAIEGPSGSGKTTLLLMAGGLLHPSEGTVMVEDVNPYTMTHDNRSRLRAQKIGFVFQQFHLIPYLTVLENITSPLGAYRGKGTEKRAKELIDHFNLKSRTRHVPSQLSAGEKQRTALARAVLNQPSVILADEPTGNLDRESAQTVLDYLSDFTKQGGAVLLVTHDENVTGYANTLLQMKGGSIEKKIGQDP